MFFSNYKALHYVVVVAVAALLPLIAANLRASRPASGLMGLNGTIRGGGLSFLKGAC